ncbi:hypothetical protein C8T65DRAFT_828873 [Cerioporus squamosus]|nr:hypothetical protein C8T65DRAFT_828873 [Cerioporus squamosus]
MSSDADAASAAIVAVFDIIYSGNYCNMAASILFIYDTFVTFDREVACFWTAKRTGGASLLFFANKWINMTYYVMLLVSFISFPSDKSCSRFSIATYAMLILQYIPGAVFSALRAYVLSSRKLVGILVASLSLAPVGANLALYGYQLSGENIQPFGCVRTVNTTDALGIRFVLISRVPLIVADLILIYITWTKLSSRDALKNIGQSKRLSLSTILFNGARQKSDSHAGTIYFVVLSVMNVLHLIFSTTALAGSGSGNQSLVTDFTAPITAILISRFLLELREAEQMVVRLDPDDPLHSSRNPYAESRPSFIASLGGFIDPVLLAQDDDSTELQVRSSSEARRGKEEDGGGGAKSIEATASLSSTV